ncbi:MAG: aminoglycoside 6-adenylyltransferase [Chloroflexi bacterium]|nr:aminoglycoside 6-adenylyltransferase [Chloroflexota bacterium]
MQKTLAQLTTIFQEREEVVALAVIGSVAISKPDAWSDIDVIVVVTDIEPFFPSLEWLRPVGEIFTYSQSSRDFRATTRLVFADLRRLDITLVTREAVLQLAPEDHVSFWQGAKVIFSHSEAITEKLTATYTPPVSTFSREDFTAMANDFWFKAVLAVTKIARDDRLIAAHLALDCLRDVMVLAMVERDMSTGTTVHRSGGMGNVFVERLSPVNDFSTASLLRLLEQTAYQFETLARRLYPDYVSPTHNLMALIHRAS